MGNGGYAVYQGALSRLEDNDRERFQDCIWYGVSLLYENNFVHAMPSSRVGCRDYVHGDLRPSNIYVSKESPKALIMDFDGSGLANSVFYSPYLITVDINWPPSTTNGEKITKAHDAYMLKRLYF